MAFNTPYTQMGGPGMLPVQTKVSDLKEDIIDEETRRNPFSPVNTIAPISEQVDGYVTVVHHTTQFLNNNNFRIVMESRANLCKTFSTCYIMCPCYLINLLPHIGASFDYTTDGCARCQLTCCPCCACFWSLPSQGRGCMAPYYHRLFIINKITQEFKFFDETNENRFYPHVNIYKRILQSDNPQLGEKLIWTKMMSLTPVALHAFYDRVLENTTDLIRQLSVDSDAHLMVRPVLTEQPIANYGQSIEEKSNLLD